LKTGPRNGKYLLHQFAQKSVQNTSSENKENCRFVNEKCHLVIFCQI